MDELKHALTTEISQEKIAEDTKSEIQKTISVMTPDVRMIFLKISEQLDDPVHPLTRICSIFHEQFKLEIEEYQHYATESLNAPGDIQSQLIDFCEDSIAQVKQFMYILYGSCVRFYSTVVEWEFLEQMKEDLIERLTSLVFEDKEFSATVLQLCAETTRESQERLIVKLRQIEGLKPIHVGIDEYLTLDKSSNLESVFKETTSGHKVADENNGDVGGSA